MLLSWLAAATVLAAEGALDPTFQMPILPAAPNAIAAQSNGKVVFSQPTADLYGHLVARLNADGTSDGSFVTGPGPQVITAEVIFNGQVLAPASTNAATILALAVQSDDKVLVGGNFSHYHGVPRGLLARLNPDGTLDTAFNNGTGFAGSNKNISTLAIAPDGKIYAGGGFSSYNGVSRSVAVVRLNPDGSLDTSFADSTIAAATGVGNISLAADGKVVITAIYATGYPGTTAVYRLNAGGGLDSTFQTGAGTAVAPFGIFHGLLPDGRILVAGGSSNYNGVTVNTTLFRLNSDGSVDTAFTAPEIRLSNVGGTIGRFKPLPDGRVYIQGAFDQVSGAARPNLARLTAEGTLDTTFVPASSGLGGLAVLPGGKLLVGGGMLVDGAYKGTIYRLNTTGGGGVTPIAPSIAQHPQSQSVAAGGTVTFTVAATGTEPLFYQWRHDSAAIPGATNASYQLSGVQLSDAGDYSVVVSNSGGSTPSNPALLSVSPAGNAPQITTQPLSRIVTLGANVTFTVQAAGLAPLFYQWSRNTTNIGSATNATLALSNVQTNNAGAYSVVVSNSLGTATSAAAILTVNQLSARQLNLGALTTNPAGLLVVPIELVSLGGEHQLSFSLTFNPAALANPQPTLLADTNTTNAAVGAVAAQLRSVSKLALPSATLTPDFTEVAQGHLGLALTLPAGTTFLAGTHRLVEVAFGRLLGDDSAAKAGLTLGVRPTPLLVSDTAGNGLPVQTTEVPAPVVASKGAMPTTPSAQTGLFTQLLSLANPGTLPANFWVLVSGLGTNSLGQRITLYNASGMSAGIPYLQYGPLAAGATVQLTAEFYVPDRTNVPQPTYTVQLVPSISTAVGTNLAQTVELRLINGVFTVEFNTLADNYYYVLYTDTLGQSNWLTSLPPVRGTGSRVQWVDSGPPRTLSGAGTNRFYRVVRYP